MATRRTGRRVRRRAHALGAAVLVALLGAAGADAAPRDVAVVQEGTSLRVSWVPDDPDDSHGVEISSSPEFPDDLDETCSTFVLRGQSALLRCLIPFHGALHVRVSPTIGTATTVTLPQAGFTFAPVPAAAQVGVARNRQTITCRATRQDFANVDGDTAFAGRITVDGAERVAADFPNPLSGRSELFAKERIAYALTGRDVGRTVRCEVTARQGAYSATRVSAARVAHASPAEKRPLLMLVEAIRPRQWYRATGGAGRLGVAARRAGALRRARLHVETVEIARTLRVDGTATTYGTAREAARSLGRGVCRDLRRSYRSGGGVVRAVASCRAVRLPGASRAYAAVTYGVARRDDGVPIIVVQAITIASVGTTSLTLGATAGDTYARRGPALTRAARAGKAYAARLVTAAVRE